MMGKKAVVELLVKKKSCRMGGLTHLPLQFMEKSMAKSFSFYLKP